MSAAPAVENGVSRGPGYANDDLGGSEGREDGGHIRYLKIKNEVVV